MFEESFTHVLEMHKSDAIDGRLNARRQGFVDFFFRKAIVSLARYLVTALYAITSDASAVAVANTRAKSSDELPGFSTFSGTLIVAPDTTSGDEWKNNATR